MTDFILYEEIDRHYKYRLGEPYSIYLLDPIPGEDAHTPRIDWTIVGEGLETPFITLDSGGTLWIRKGYAWDGPSGWSIDTKTFMRGSLVHDALYQLMREFPGCVSREFADDLLWKICRYDGMYKFRAWYVRKAVRMFGRRSAEPRAARKTLRAPS